MLSRGHPPIPEAASEDESATTTFDFGFQRNGRKSHFARPPFKNQALSSRQANGNTILTVIGSEGRPSSRPSEVSATRNTDRNEASTSSNANTSQENSSRSSNAGSGNASTSASSAYSCMSCDHEHHTSSGRDPATCDHLQPPYFDTFSDPSSLDSPPNASDGAQAYAAKTSLQRITAGSRGSNQGVSRPLLDVLSMETFLDAMENPPVRHRLYNFTETSLCREYMSFLDQIRYHKKLVAESAKAMADIDTIFLSPASDSHIDLSSPTHEELRDDISTVHNETYPSISSLFDDAVESVQKAIYDTVYSDFVREQLALSASEALSNDRHRYQGLGDCFCLTDPSKADNPILFASDGFVAVTGYERKDIIPRNCRFLQGKQTDNLAVRRISESIQRAEESVEFLLNYRKNGEPFWNLLYTAPLFDAQGKVAFFIGGQVNCSSSIHGKPDIMRVLATSPEHEDESNKPKDKPRNTPAANLIRRVDRIKSLKYRLQAEVAEEPGAERRLIEANQTGDSPTRIERFYNAYSKYLVMTYPDMNIHFSSDGVSDILDLDPDTPTIGNNAFKFLKQNMLMKDKSDWKHRVEVALKGGKPISVKVNLKTKRSKVFRGDERFLTHWTPLKDVEGRTRWVVVCLGAVTEM